jgi:hypothetical protein
MMKRIKAFFLTALICMAVSLQAQPGTAVWDSAYDKWDLAVSLSGALSYNFRVAAYPSIELIVSSIKIDDFMPIDFGVSARGLITKYEKAKDPSKPGWFHIGIGLAATAHISFDNLQEHTLPFMENFDFYVALGPVYDIIDYTGSYAGSQPPIPSNGFGITTAGGIRYFVLDWLAVNFEVFNWSFSPGLAAGLTFNF